MRLLTEEEIGLLEWESGTLNMVFTDNHKAEIQALNKAQRDLTHKETLKAVGEWLKKKYKGKADVAPLFVVPIYSMDLEALKRGEWPEEGK